MEEFRCFHALYGGCTYHTVIFFFFFFYHCALGVAFPALPLSYLSKSRADLDAMRIAE